MKSFLESLKLALQIVALIIPLGLFAVLIVSPNQFARGFDSIVEGMLGKNVDFRFSFFGVSLARTDSEQKEAFALVGKMDEARNSASQCIAEQNCDAALILKSLGIDINPSIRMFAVPVTRQASAFKDWVLVIGADKNLEAAQYEAQTLTSFGFTASIILRDSWFRTVVSFDTSKEAAAATEEIENALNGRQAYPRLLSAWCVNTPIPVESQDFYTCAPQ